MAGESRYVTGWSGVNGPHVILDRPGLTAHMYATAVCGERTVTATVFGCYKETWLPAYGGCVNCVKVLGAKQ
jgi:hypothetical protein